MGRSQVRELGKSAFILFALFAFVVIVGSWIAPLPSFAQTPLPAPFIPAVISGGGTGGASNLTTVGAIPYVSAAGVLNQDQTAAHQLFWDATNHRLGVGTASPSYRLHIVGAGNNATNLTLEGTTNGGGVSSGLLRWISSLSAKNYYMGIGGSSELYIFDSSRAATVLSINSTTGAVTLPAANLIVTTPTTPASAAAAGVVGTVAWDTGFIYICTATNTWKRVAIATW